MTTTNTEPAPDAELALLNGRKSYNVLVLGDEEEAALREMVNDVYQHGRAQVAAERDAALARADTEHAARVRLVEQYNALDTEAVAMKDALDAARYGAATWKRAAKRWRALAYETHMTTADVLNYATYRRDFQRKSRRVYRLEAGYAKAVSARDNCATEHSRALLRVGALEGLLLRAQVNMWGDVGGLVADIDAALAGTVT